jgi:ketosteroid isomerase-like protein
MIACTVGLFAGASYAKQKKKAEDTAATTPPSSAQSSSDQGNAIPNVPIPIFDQLDHEIGEMLGAWQVGDVEGMHKYYDDNATFVSGAFAPPIVGWKNYVAAYEQQRAHVGAMQFVRKNTFIFTKGDFAWATYQWEIGAMVDGRPTSDRGQTTLVFFHAGDRWLIVHNHTSDIWEPPAQPVQNAQPQPHPSGTQNP